MLNPRPPAAQPAPAAVTAIAALLAKRTGQDIAPGRLWRIDSSLRPLLRDRAMPDLSALVTALGGETGGPLADAVVDAVLNQETSWFRDAGVIELAADVMTAAAEDRAGYRPRAWSAGCSVGQEPYSLAMVLAERCPEGGTLPEIVATDVSAATVARARAGRYTQFEIQRGLPIRRLLRWFEQDDSHFVVRPDLAARVAFRRQNLVSDPPPAGGFDLILCRNVLLYFEPAVRAAVFARLASALRPGGVLILGAGETTIGQTDRFVPSRRFRGGYDVVAAPGAVRR